MGLVGVADHAEQGLVPVHAVDGETRVENLVAAVFAVGLGKHHEFDVAWVALHLHKRLHQIVDLVIGQCQPEAGVGGHQSRPAPGQYVHLGQGRGRQGGEQGMGLCALEHHALGHAVVQQGGNGL